MINFKTKVAVTGVTNLHDARYCAGMGVDWVIFPIDPALESTVSKEDFAEITGWVTGPLFFGEVAAADDITITDFQVDGLLTDNASILSQLGDNMPVAWKISLQGKSKEEIIEDLEKHQKQANWFLLEMPIDFIKLEEAWLADLCKKHPIVISCDFEPESANMAIDQLQPLGIGLKGGKELKVGLNDFDGWADVLEAIELEED